MTSDPQTGPLPLRLELSWAMGSMAVATMQTLIGIFLLRYLTDIVGIAAAIAGLVLGGSKIYDAFADLFIGRRSDRSRSVRGRRRPFLLAGGILAGFAIFALFATSIGPSPWREIYLLAVLLTYTTGYAMLQIPISPWPPR